MYLKATRSRTPDMVLGIAAACNAEVLATFTSAPMAVKLKALHNVMHLAAHYRTIAPMITDDRRREAKSQILSTAP